ncbi:MAG TPA: SMC-Scp complex subunit ScpB [Oculatellaceae cyanobacterium]
MKLKSQLEAILFLSDKPVKAAAMARIVAQDVQLVRQALLELIHDYEERDGGLEIADDDGYIIQVRDAYASIVDEFAPMEMPVSLIRTLSAIAIKQPVPQSEIIKIRGAGAYDHIKELVERELIVKKEEGGRSPQLSTTKKFQEYFRLTQDAKVLRNQLSADTKAAKEALAGEAAAVEEGQELIVAGLKGSIDSQKADEDSEALELNINHLESRVELEKVFATSPDASLVFRAPVHEGAAGSAASSSDEKHVETENATDEGSSN